MTRYRSRTNCKLFVLCVLAFSLAIGCDNNSTSKRSVTESAFGGLGAKQASANRASIIGQWGVASKGPPLGNRISIYEFQSDGMATGTVVSSIGTAKFVGQWKEEKGKHYMFGKLFAISGSSSNSTPHACELIAHPNGQLAIDGVLHARQ